MKKQKKSNKLPKKSSNKKKLPARKAKKTKQIKEKFITREEALLKIAARSKKEAAKKKKEAGQKLSKKDRLFEDRVKAVIDRGRERGLITETEILKFFPNVEKDITELERLYDRLEEADIKVEENREFIEKTIPEPSEDEINRALNIEADDTFASDSVQMYLREIGKTPLLTSSEEKELAKIGRAHV